jgi:hypothetical protein
MSATATIARGRVAANAIATRHFNAWKLPFQPLATSCRIAHKDSLVAGAQNARNATVP